MSEQLNNSTVQSASQPVISTHEHLLTLSEAARHIPSINGKRHSTVSLWRWCRRGIRGVQLEYLRIGRSIMTSQEALDRFYLALALADPTLPLSKRVPAHYGPKHSSLRQRQIEASKSRLKEAGF